MGLRGEMGTLVVMEAKRVGGMGKTREFEKNPIGESKEKFFGVEGNPSLPPGHHNTCANI